MSVPRERENTGPVTRMFGPDSDFDSDFDQDAGAEEYGTRHPKSEMPRKAALGNE